VRYRVTVAELVPAKPSTGEAFGSPEADGAVIFSTVVDHRPDTVKLSEALKAPRIRKPRSQKAS
jgi:hypothetical protein